MNVLRPALLGAIPFNIHTPLCTRSIKFEPLRKKDQSADTNTPQKLRNFSLTPQKKRKDQRMPMHTTPQKQLFQTPSEILVHRGVCILNGMAPRTPKARKLLPFDVKHDLTPDSKSPGLPRTKCRTVVQGWNLYF